MPIPAAFDLSGRVAVVTGAGAPDGIGFAAARLLAELGAAVLISATTARIQDRASELRSAGFDALGIAGDLTDADVAGGLVSAALAQWGRLDILVNNAGVETRTSVLDTTEADYDRVLAINLKSAFFGTQFAARQMIKQGGGGRIINISSVHEDWPMPGNAPYCLSKGGMRMLTRTAAVELARHNILVSGVAPGAVATPINQATMGNPELLKKLEGAIPLGRMAKPEEIARVVAFLAGDGGSYITGTTVVADGGIMQSSPGL